MNNYYLTTAINYTNGSPHIGHAYEIICTDIIANYHRLYGKNVLFATGTDEHGQKIKETATNANLLPIQLCDKYVDEFINMNKILNISNDVFTRTTNEKHMEVAKLVWDKALENGDIYLSEYDGWYSVKEEKFVTEVEAKKTNYIDPINGQKLIKHTTPAYFFRSSKYHDAIVEHINTHPNFILPIDIRNETLTRLNETPLEDICISRTKQQLSWGIPINDDHVMYVWFDALTNYLTAIDYPNNTNNFWPANLHVIGKDISWFHVVIWPAMLMSIKEQLPTTILCHGFINDNGGIKMSKSIGNVIDPLAILNKYGSDCVRSYLAFATNIGPDICFTEKYLVEFHDHYLVAKFSNLVNRCYVLAFKLSNGKIPNGISKELFNIDEFRVDIYKELELFNIKNILQIIFAKLDIVNKYISDTKPWEKKDGSNDVLKTSLEALYIIGHYLQPFIPTSINILLKFLNMELTNVYDLRWNNLVIGNDLRECPIIFKQIGLTRIEKK